jgi:chemotaxis protein MotB
MRNKDKKGLLHRSDESPAGGWEIIFSGFILILLCFFIMLSSFSTMEAAKIMKFVKSFVSAVSILPGGLKFDQGSAILPDSPDMVDNRSELAQVFAELTTLSARLDLKDDLEISYCPAGLVMRLTDHALFEAGAAAISQHALPMLEKMGAIIAKTPTDVRIEGHTDSLPIRTVQFPSNWELSTARAVNVLRYFVETHGIPAERLSAAGFGEFQPIAANASPDHRAKNRRVEIIFLNPDQKRISTEGTD